jgi:hypothetical protein
MFVQATFMLVVGGMVEKASVSKTYIYLQSSIQAVVIYVALL